LSENYKTVEHSFSGTAEEKSSVTVVKFEKPSQIKFLPTQILNDFPQLNGIWIESCNTFTIIKENFFGQNFNMIEYLGLQSNKIEAIEANAFQHLPKLKWISLSSNQLRSLPQQIFKNNPEMILIGLPGNKIKSITPDFFKNLSKLQYVLFADFDQCTKKTFGCYTESCSVTQAALDRGLTTCYKNCLDDVECAAKSGKLDNLSSEQIENNLNLIIASGHTATLMEKGYGALIPKNDSKPKPEVVQEEIENIKNETLECDAKKFEEISEDLKELKAQHETLGNNLTLLVQSNAECKNDSGSIHSELKSLKQELADLKLTLEEIKNYSDDKEKLKMELGELFKKEFKEFVRELKEGA
jgi:Leucine-rich repeat (LRR) protein